MEKIKNPTINKNKVKKQINRLYINGMNQLKKNMKQKQIKKS